MNDSLLSKTISYLRFPLIVGVVFIHSNILVVNIQGTVIRYDRWPVVAFVINLFSSVFADICVPLFFFFSGFLFYYNSDFSKLVYVNKVKKRVRTLFIPYLIWNFFAFLILLIQVHPRIVRFFPLLYDYRVDITSFLSSFWITNLPISMSGPANPINTPLWFIRDLMVLVLLSPIIWWLIKQFKLITVIILGIIWFFSLGEIIGFPGLSHQSLFFFPLGAYFGVNKLNFVELIRKMGWIPFLYFGFAIVDAVSKNESYNAAFHNIGILFGMVSVVYLVSLLLRIDKIHANDFLIGASFFVYALHNLFLGKMTKIVVMYIRPESPIILLFVFFMMPIVAITLCLLLYKLLNQLSPKICSVLTGGR